MTNSQGGQCMKNRSAYRSAGIASLGLLLVLSGCSAQNAESAAPESRTDMSSEESGSRVSSLDESSAKALDTYREKAEALYNQFRDLSDQVLSSDQVQELKEKISEESKALYEDGQSAYSDAYDRLSKDTQLQQSMDELKQKTQELMGQMSDQTEDLDLSGLTEAMKNFDQSYFRANNLR